MVKKQKHGLIDRSFRYHSGDCYLFTNHCLCGAELTDWSQGMADEKYKKHVEENEKK
jgi:hypothetical protein